MVLTDLDKYEDEWPQVGQVTEIAGNDEVLIHWFKGTKTTAWTPCTVPMPGQRGRRMAWLETINKQDILLKCQLTGKNMLPKHVKDQLDNLE